MALRLWACALLATAAGVSLLLAWGLGHRVVPDRAQQPPRIPAPAPEDVIEVFPVAIASEVSILSVEGADTQTVVVGRLPLLGAMELAGPGDVALTSVQPDRRDNMVPHVRIGGAHRPMIWAPVEAEASER